MATLEERYPELFRPVSTESPRGKKRSVPMQVLCLGFPQDRYIIRAAAMCAALEMLGIPCWHSTCFLSTNFADLEMWQEMIDRKFFSHGKGQPVGREEPDQLLHSFGAVSSDTPAVAFAEELIAAYPEAKVVLVEREIESWHKSYMHGVIGNMSDPFITLVYHLDRFYVHPIGRVHKGVTAGWLDIWSKRDGDLKGRAKCSQHYDVVRRVTPEDSVAIAASA